MEYIFRYGNTGWNAPTLWHEENIVFLSVLCVTQQDCKDLATNEHTLSVCYSLICTNRLLPCINMLILLSTEVPAI